ncbi:MAG: rhodanese-like domain-containing protein [Rhodospirillales bacterium]|nr:rhodanese-like domain-containing protein [Rhodospirillales bacterium]
MTQPPHLRELTPKEVHDGLAHHSLTLVDVREAAEFAAERIHGALLYPLSTFDPATLPMDPARPVVFQCGTGKRSAMAAQRCAQAGVPISTHLAGGLAAWKHAHFPTIQIDPRTGAVVDRK